MVPAVAQQQPSPSQDNNNQPAATQPADQQSGNQAQSSQQGSHQPLELETRQGFWGKLNPFARKKYVNRQLQPIVDRTNELDELTKSNAKSIQDVDARAQAGIKDASAKATEADNNAVQAGNKAEAAQKTATEATNRIQTVEQVVTNIDQYKPVTQVEILFRSGQTTLSKQAQDALDQLANGLGDQKGYVIQVQGFSPTRGTAGIDNSERMAAACARYLVANHNVPIYRLRVLGVGNVPSQPASGTNESNAPASNSSASSRRPRVEISLLKNDLEQLSNVQPMQAPATSAQQ
jgi:outer membrane protein OmpA-like peptidoglycan-associated protein